MVLHRIRGKLGLSLTKKCLLIYRSSPPWYFYMSNVIHTIYNISGKLLKNHSYKEFETMIRPILLPNEKLKDISFQGWDKNNNLFQYWLRYQYLNKRFGYTNIYKQAEKQLEDQSKLPSIKDICKIFNIQSWNYKKSYEKYIIEKQIEKDILEKIKQEKENNNEIDNKQDNNNERSIKHLEFEDILELSGCAIKGMNEFNIFCEKNKIYEFFTNDYIQLFGQYLVERSLYISKIKNKDHITILEVGAGSGVLGYFLSNQSPLYKYNNSNPKISIEYIYTDSGKSKLHINPKFNVIPVKYSKALTIYQPDIIVCSWMPMDEDWSVYFRQFTCVYEYILIGEYDDGCCGHNWFTWGNKKEYPKKTNNLSPNFQRLLTSKPPYKLDNYKRIYLQNLSELQYCRYDNKYFKGYSGTISFRKQ